VRGKPSIQGLLSVASGTFQTVYPILIQSELFKILCSLHPNFIKKGIIITTGGTTVSNIMIA
jgi:hypothetical protein